MFLINLNTHIAYNGDNKAVKNAIGILERDIKNALIRRNTRRMKFC